MAWEYRLDDLNLKWRGHEIPHQQEEWTCSKI